MSMTSSSYYADIEGKLQSTVCAYLACTASELLLLAAAVRVEAAAAPVRLCTHTHSRLLLSAVAAGANVLDVGQTP